ncbi:MAG: glycosyltransferase family 39 protein, partial [Phycisphaerae bacterium]|nr:glycosyltransferase family 39 protein [Phycisphaerae bacterium]
MDSTISQAPDLTVSDERLRWRIVWVLVALGVALRIWQWLWNTGFWHDELWLLGNIQDRSFGGLIGPLDRDQAAPLLYLWLLKAIYLLAGLNELALRAPSVIAAVAGMVLMLPLARRCVRTSAVPWALVMLAASKYLIIFSVRTKPYTIDALAAMVLLYAALRLRRASPLKFILALGA